MNSVLSQYVNTGLRRSAFVLAILSSVSLVGILFVIVLSVVLRKFFDAPLYFAEELVGLLMSASLFLALPMATIKGQHIRITLLLDYLSVRAPLLMKAIQLAGIVVGIAFMGWVFMEAIPWMEFAIKRELKSETARILLYPLMSVIPISTALCCSIYCARLVGFIDIEER